MNTVQASGPVDARLIVLVGDLTAKNGRIARAAGTAAAVFRANGYSTQILGTQPPEGEPGTMATWSASLQHALTDLAEAPCAVVAVGGDGMAHLVLNVLLDHAAERGTRIPFGLVPCGSGNDLARHWGTPHDDPEAAAGRILRRLDLGPIPMDLGRVRFDDGSTAWFATALCAGIDAAVNQRANRWKRPAGSLKYLFALAVEVVRHPPHIYGLAVTPTPEPSESPRDLSAPTPERTGSSSLQCREALMVNVANTSSIGGGLRIVPEADPTDGRLHLFVVDPLTRLRFLRLFPSIYTGDHVSVRQVEITPVSHVRITGQHVVYADGEPLGELPVTVDGVPGAVPVLL
ncbi:diacylglycerol/lipid kinase family protein [Kocuria soli]|uniref:diacylglycerol/lipid kinase family protein n=1 Tax=Kocuria soli TaxID=2485125 RepID=UPI00131578CF|nr:diacylglycerol kinase family protein [Kocuria soli]